MEKKFLRYLIDLLAGLTFDYEKFLSAYNNAEKMTAAAASNQKSFHDLSINRLKDEINLFRKFLKECFNHYAIIRQCGINVNFSRGDLKREIDKLINVRKRVGRKIPLEFFKKRLSPEEFRFHQYIENLTPKKMEAFYEINYHLLYQEEEEN